MCKPSTARAYDVFSPRKAVLLYLCKPFPVITIYGILGLSDDFKLYRYMQTFSRRHLLCNPSFNRRAISLSANYTNHKFEHYFAVRLNA